MADFYKDPLGWAIENMPDDNVEPAPITEEEWEEKTRSYYENE